MATTPSRPYSTFDMIISNGDDHIQPTPVPSMHTTPASQKRLDLWRKRVGFEEAWLSFDDTLRVVRDFFERNPLPSIQEGCA